MAPSPAQDTMQIGSIGPTLMEASRRSHLRGLTTRWIGGLDTGVREEVEG